MLRWEVSWAEKGNRGRCRKTGRHTTELRHPSDLKYRYARVGHYCCETVSSFWRHLDHGLRAGQEENLPHFQVG